MVVQKRDFAAHQVSPEIREAAEGVRQALDQAQETRLIISS